MYPMQPLHPPARQDVEQLIGTMSVTALAAALALQTENFRRRRSSNDAFGLALFTLAIAQHNEEAWTFLYQQYAPLVMTWISQHAGAAELYEQDGYAPLVNAAFAKFAQAVTPAKLANFASLAALLQYLKMCGHSVVVDEVRARQARQYEETLERIEQEPTADDPADDVVSTISAQSLWQIIQEELKSEHERVLISLAYVYGMKPSEIRSQHPHLFPTVDDVYRVKRTVLERLRRNRRVQAFTRCM